jgi:hypothetical protein
MTFQPSINAHFNDTSTILQRYFNDSYRKTIVEVSLMYCRNDDGRRAQQGRRLFYWTAGQ